MAIADLESCLSFVTFLDPYLIIGIDEVQMGESLCLAPLV